MDTDQLELTQPAPGSPLQEMALDLPPPPASYPRKNLAYVEVPRSRRKRPRAPSVIPPAGSDSESDNEPPRRTSDSESDNEPPRRTLVLDESHPKFLLKAEKYLLAVPGNDDWKFLLSRYLEFEKLVPQVALSNFCSSCRSSRMIRPEGRSTPSLVPTKSVGGSAMVAVTSRRYP